MVYYVDENNNMDLEDEDMTEDPTAEMESVADVVEGAGFMEDAENDYIYMVDLAANVPSIEDAYEAKEAERGCVTVNDVMVIHGCPVYLSSIGKVHVDYPLFRDYPNASDVVEVAYQMLKSVE